MHRLQRILLKPSTFVFLALVAGLAGPAHADEAQSTVCPVEAETTLRALLAASFETKGASRGELRQLICMPLPRAGKGHLAALANFVESNGGGLYDLIETYTVVLAELNAEGSRIHRHVVGSIESDVILAYGPDSFALEAQWQDLGPDGGAVGVKSDSSAPGPAAPPGASSDFFTLFVPDGDGYTKALDLARYRSESIEGCLKGMCPGSRWTSTATTLTPGERDADGWRRVAMRIDIEELADEPAVVQSEPRSTTLLLQFKSGRYALPDGDAIPGSDASISPW